MADKGMTLAIVLLVAGLIVGGGIGYFAAPAKDNGSGTTTNTGTTQVVTEAPLKGQTIRIGYIAPSTTTLETAKPHMEKVVAPDLNAQMALLNWDGPTFQFLMEDAVGQANTHLEKVQGFKSMGVDAFQGGGWSSQAQASLSYVNANDMLMWSAMSTSPTLSIANDNLFRMCPADSALAPALVDMMWSYGIKSVIIFQRGDSWGDGIVNLFVPAWQAKGGEIAGQIVRYAAESTDFSNYLDQANGMASEAVAKYNGDTEKVGVLLLSFDEFPVIASQAKDYTPLYNLPFFGGDGTAVSQRGMDDAPEQVNHMRVFSMMAQAPDSSTYSALKARYEALTQQQYTAYTAYQYDIMFVIANSMIQAQSTSANDIVPLQIPTANAMWGASGWLQMNQYGDRAAPPFNVWFYAPSDTKASFSYVGGVYYPDTGVMTWNTGALQQHLGYVPAGP